MLFDARAARPRPQLDDKVLTAWNGLMIAAFAARRARARPSRPQAGEWLGARRGAPPPSSRRHLCEAEERVLLRRYRDGDAAIDGYAEDYAYLIWGLLELFQADGDAAVARVGARAASRRRTSCSGTTPTAAGSARPATIPACCCG